MVPTQLKYVEAGDQSMQEAWGEIVKMRNRKRGKR
jgi:hypothetical protein